MSVPDFASAPLWRAARATSLLAGADAVSVTALPLLRIDADASSGDEGADGVTAFTFSVSRSGDLSAPSSVDWSVSGSGAHPASAADFAGASFPAGTLTFAAGQVSVSLSVPVQGDAVFEADGGFCVALRHPLGAVIDDGAGVSRMDESVDSDYPVTEHFYTLDGDAGSFVLTSDAASMPLAVNLYVNSVWAAGNGADTPYAGSVRIPATLALHAGDQIDVVISGTPSQSHWDYRLAYAPGLHADGAIASAVIINDDAAPDDHPDGIVGAADLAVGRSVAGHIENLDDADWFSVSLVAGQRYQFNLEARAFDGLSDPYLALYDADGKLVDSDDDSGAGLGAQLGVTAPDSAVYYLSASSGAGGTGLGGYLLYGANAPAAPADDFAANRSSTGRIGPNASIAGHIDNALDQDWFGIALQAGKHYDFTLAGADVGPLDSPHLALYNSAGTLVLDAPGQGSAMAFSPSSSAQYYLAASAAHPGQTGNYVLSVAGPSAPAPDTRAPVLLAVHMHGADVVVNFSEAIARGTGAIVLQDAAGGYVDSFDAATSSRVNVSGSTLTISPVHPLAGNTGYQLAFEAGAVLDLAGNASAPRGGDAFGSGAGGAAPTLAGSAGNDALLGSAGCDQFSGSAGNDVLDGAGGLDQLRYPGLRSDYTVTPASGGASFVHKPGGAGTDVVSAIERLQFDDGSIGLDGVSAQVYRLYQAAFDRVPDPGGLGFWIHAMDGGSTLVELASAFGSSAEFKALYGEQPGNAQLVGALYANVMHRAPDSGGFDYWLGVLDHHLVTAAQTLAFFSESAENQAALIGVIQSGVAFTPYG